MVVSSHVEDAVVSDAVDSDVEVDHVVQPDKGLSTPTLVHNRPKAARLAECELADTDQEAAVEVSAVDTDAVSSKVKMVK